ncbi:MAG: TolC family protein [Opitutales bacterium]|nr:TolC family protein [Opitutales bacterium]
MNSNDSTPPSHGIRLFLAISVGLLSCSLSAELTLDQVIYEAISNNKSLQIESKDPLIQEQNLIVEEAQFDTTLFGSYNFSESSLDRETNDGSVNEFSESVQVSGGVRKDFSLGTAVTLQTYYQSREGRTYNSELDQFFGGDPSYNTFIRLNVRQPLLRGFGRKANLAGIHQAQKQIEIAKLEYTNLLLDVVNQTEKAYWRLAFQNARLALTTTSLEVAENLLKETEQREELGLATKLDVLQAKANLASQKENYIEAQRGVEDASDELLTYMGKMAPGMADQSIQVSPLPNLGPSVPNIGTAWGGALNTDLDLTIQKLRIESLGFDEIILKDREKTQLDLVLSGRSNGLSDSRKSAITGSLEKQGYDASIGIELNVPIGKRASKANLKRVELQIDREELRYDRFEENLYQIVRQRLRTFEVSLEKLEAARTTLELRNEFFEQEQVKYTNGLAVFRDVQEAQDDLNRARISELNAWLSALQAKADLARLDGSLLKERNISIEFQK